MSIPLLQSISYEAVPPSHHQILIAHGLTL